LEKLTPEFFKEPLIVVDNSPEDLTQDETEQTTETQDTAETQDTGETEETVETEDTAETQGTVESNGECKNCLFYQTCEIHNSSFRVCKALNCFNFVTNNL
jgi:hypothetical protein